MVTEIAKMIAESGGEYAPLAGLYAVAFGVPYSTALLIEKKWTLKQLSNVRPELLERIPGVGRGTSARVTAMMELSRRLECYTEEPKRKVCSPRDVYAYLYPMYREMKKELFRCLYLDTKNQILKNETVSVGSLDASIVHPREVFKTALELSAASVILSHNHPSGDPSPSREDILVTEKLVEGGKLLGIDVLDHTIIGEGRYVSMKEEGFMR